MRAPLAAALSLAAAGQAAAQAAPDSQVVRQLLAADSAYEAAWVRGDRAAVDRLTAGTFVDTDASGVVRAKAAVLSLVVAPPPGGAPGFSTWTDLRVDVYGDAAVLTVRKTYRLPSGAQPPVLAQRITDVFVRRGGRWLLAASHQSDLPPPRVVVRVDPAAFDAYVGQYAVGPADTVTLTREGSKLMARRTGRAPIEMQPLSATEFFIEGFPATYTFRRDASGAVIAEVVRVGGVEYARPRIR